MLEKGTLLLEIDYQNQTYYLSDTAITNENVYWPYIAQFPSFSISGEGYSRVNLGTISLIRDEANDFHPFGGSRYSDLLKTVQKISFRLFLNEQRTSLFEGSLALENVSETVITLTIMEQEYEEDLVLPVLDEERKIVDRFLFELIDSEYRLLCWMPDNPFFDSQELIFERISADSRLDAILYQPTEENKYLVNNREINNFHILLEEDALSYVNAELLDIDPATDLLLLTDLTPFGFSTSRVIYKLVDDDVDSVTSLAKDPIRHHTGTPVSNPFSFGKITVKDPVVKKGGTLKVENGEIVEDVTGGRFQIHNPSIDVSAVDSSGKYFLKFHDDGVLLTGETTEIVNGVSTTRTPEIDIASSDNSVISLMNKPAGALAISGISRHGSTIQEFFDYCASVLSNDINNLDLTCNLDLAPDASTIEIAFYQDGEITVIEMAEQVARKLNYFFWIKPYFDFSTRQIRRQIQLVDINKSLLLDALHTSEQNVATGEWILPNSYDDERLIKIDIAYPFPVKALETTLTRNEIYLVEAGQDRSSSMKSRSLTIRVKTDYNFGNPKTVETIAQTVAETKYWLNRHKELDGLPVINATIRGIPTLDELCLGKKVSVIDHVRKVRFKMLVQELSYDFNLQQTSFKGLAVISKIVYS